MIIQIEHNEISVGLERTERIVSLKRQECVCHFLR